jgi:N-acetylmuramoyl-L-alanine amidase
MYSYMWTTKQQDFPSVLLEMGFVSNYEDAMALANPTHQDGIAQAIVDGIVEYLQRSTISSY